jgi:hypothetical protein
VRPRMQGWPVASRITHLLLHAWSDHAGGAVAHDAIVTTWRPRLSLKLLLTAASAVPGPTRGQEPNPAIREAVEFPTRPSSHAIAPRTGGGVWVRTGPRVGGPVPCTRFVAPVGV